MNGLQVKHRPDALLCNNASQPYPDDRRIDPIGLKGIEIWAQMAGQPQTNERRIDTSSKGRRYLVPNLPWTTLL